MKELVFGTVGILAIAGILLYRYYRSKTNRDFLDKTRNRSSSTKLPSTPNDMEDEFNGSVTWDKNPQPSGIMTFANGKTAAFDIDGYDDQSERITEAARNTLKFLIANEPLIRHKVAVSVREFFKDTWLYEDPITPEQLAQRINLVWVSIFDEGGGNLVYEADDDLFTDHCIEILMDANGEIGEPSLEG
jgi:hypothetical protein